MLAICISGAFRNFEETWPENEKIFQATGMPYRIFMHTWTQDFSTTRKVYRDTNWHGFNISLRPKKYQDFIGKVDLDKIKKVIPHSSVLLENFNEDSICSEFQIPYKHETKIYQNILNSIAMYVGISKSFNLARLDKDFENYTHFVRIRTDFVLEKSIPVKVFSSDLYFGGPGVETGTGYVSDQLFIMKKPLIAEICDLPRFIIDYVNENSWQLDSTSPFYAERILSALFQNCNLKPTILSDPIIGKVKRPAITSSDELSRIIYLKEMVQYNLNAVKRKLIMLVVRIFQR
jgi:hypothetical protein